MIRDDSSVARPRLHIVREKNTRSRHGTTRSAITDITLESAIRSFLVYRRPRPVFSCNPIAAVVVRRPHRRALTCLCSCPRLSFQLPRGKSSPPIYPPSNILRSSPFIFPLSVSQGLFVSCSCRRGKSWVGVSIVLVILVLEGTLTTWVTNLT